MSDLPLLFSPKSMHSDWLLAWEFSIPDQSLRDEMLDNPRINTQIIENIANTNNLPSLKAEYLNNDVQLICNMISENVDQFADTCGLALMGNALRRLITSHDLSSYIEAFDLQILQTAMQAQIDYPRYSALNFETEHLNDVVRKAGYRTIVGWSWSIEQSIGGRVRMLLPANFSTLSEMTETIEPAIAAKTVQTIASLSKVNHTTSTSGTNAVNHH